jgi:hypothetical protein
VAVTVVILVVALFALASAVSMGLKIVQRNRENTLATQAGRQIVEVLSNFDQIAFSDVFAAYNSDPNDDPGGFDTGPGNNFPVRDLIPMKGDLDGFVGEIIFPIGAPSELREDTAGRDLNGDAAIDALDHSGDYKLLPVTVKVQWTGIVGDHTVDFNVLLANR